MQSVPAYIFPSFWQILTELLGRIAFKTFDGGCQFIKLKYTLNLFTTVLRMKIKTKLYNNLIYFVRFANSHEYRIQHQEQSQTVQLLV